MFILASKINLQIKNITEHKFLKGFIVQGITTNSLKLSIFLTRLVKVPPLEPSCLHLPRDLLTQLAILLTLRMDGEQTVVALEK